METLYSCTVWPKSVTCMYVHASVGPVEKYKSLISLAHGCMKNIKSTQRPRICTWTMYPWTGTHGLDSWDSWAWPMDSWTVCMDQIQTMGPSFNSKCQAIRAVQSMFTTQVIIRHSFSLKLITWIYLCYVYLSIFVSLRDTVPKIYASVRGGERKGCMLPWKVFWETI